MAFMLIGDSMNLCFGAPDISEAQQVPFDEETRLKEQRRLYCTIQYCCDIWSVAENTNATSSNLSHTLMGKNGTTSFGTTRIAASNTTQHSAWLREYHLSHCSQETI